MHPNSNTIAGAIDTALNALSRERLSLTGVNLTRSVISPQNSETPEVLEVTAEDDSLRCLVFQARRYTTDARWSVLRHNPGSWEREVDALLTRIPQLEDEMREARSEIEKLTDQRIALERDMLFCPVDQLPAKRAALTGLNVQIDEQVRRLEAARRAEEKREDRGGGRK